MYKFEIRTAINDPGLVVLPTHRALTAFFQERLQGYQVSDRSALYEGYNDFNKMLEEQTKARNQDTPPLTFISLSDKSTHST